jgi:hypothetical protein
MKPTIFRFAERMVPQPTMRPCAPRKYTHVPIIVSGEEFEKKWLKTISEPVQRERKPHRIFSNIF